MYWFYQQKSFFSQKLFAPDLNMGKNHGILWHGIPKTNKTNGSTVEAKCVSPCENSLYQHNSIVGNAVLSVPKISIFSFNLHLTNPQPYEQRFAKGAHAIGCCSVSLLWKGGGFCEAKDGGLIRVSSLKRTNSRQIRRVRRPWQTKLTQANNPALRTDNAGIVRCRLTACNNILNSLQIWFLRIKKSRQKQSASAVHLC